MDSYFEGTLPEFMKENPGIYTRKNELKSEFRKANEIIGRVKSDTLFMQFMGGAKAGHYDLLTCLGFHGRLKNGTANLPGVCITDH